MHQQSIPTLLGILQDASQTDLSRQRIESSMNRSLIQSIAPVRDEQIGGHRSPCPMSLTSGDVVSKHRAGRCMQRHQAGLAQYNPDALGSQTPGPRVRRSGWCRLGSQSSRFSGKFSGTNQSAARRGSFYTNFRKALTAFLEHGGSGSRTERAWAPWRHRKAISCTGIYHDVSS
jgi:hypothetical protein